MSGSCEGESCETSKTSCSSESCCESSGCEEKCGCGTACGGDPLACAEGMWKSAFFPALRAAQIETLKGKIQKAWGPRLDKAADIILEAFGAKWQEMLAEAETKNEVREKLRALYRESRKS